MSKPLLHTQVRDVLDIPMPPHIVAQRLQALLPPTMSLELGDLEGDDIEFTAIRTNDINQQEIRITGVMQRWQGTDTRLRLHAVVDVPAPSQNLQHALVVLVIIVMSIIYGRFIGIQSLISDLTEGFMSAYAILGVFGLWLILVIITGWISYWLIVRDTASERRWHVQQELNGVLNRIRALARQNTVSDDA